MKKAQGLIILILFILIVPAAYSQEDNQFLKEGIKEYQAENYEEAIEVLEKARIREPQSSMAAFFLGMSYKKTMDFKKALPRLKDALTMRPAVKEALVEYVDILFQLDQLAEAKKWIAVAEKENIAPANIAFLQGMILAKEKKYKEAIPSFEKAKQLDPQMAQTAEYQIAMCFLGDRKLKEAKERFKATASYDPNSDLAAYARQYLDAVEKSLFYTRPIRVTLGLFGGYDSNIVSKSRHEGFSGGIGDPGCGVLSPSLRLEFVPVLQSQWLFNAMYSSAANFNEHFVHSRDSIANTISVLPGYNFGRFSISLLGSYTGYTLRTDSDASPDYNAGYKHYMDYFTGGPIIKVMLTQNQILEAFSGYDKKNYYNQVITSADSMRDAEGIRAYIGWTWFYWPNGFINLRYDLAREATNGRDWDNTSQRTSATLLLPILPDSIAQKIGSMYIQLVGSFTQQDYLYSRTFPEVDGSNVTDVRQDRIYTGTASFNWEITKNWNIVFQYTHTKWDSNMPVYEYTRNQYTAGLELKF